MYFEFDVPQNELSKMGIAVVTNSIQKYKRQSSFDRHQYNELREKWFLKYILKNISIDQNGLLIMGSEHLSAIKKSLLDLGYQAKDRDLTREKWYRELLWPFEQYCQ